MRQERNGYGKEWSYRVSSKLQSVLTQRSVSYGWFHEG